MLFMDVTACGDLGPVVSFLKGVLTIIQWAIPILLIIMGSIDLGKAVLSSDDKEIKGATSKLVKRAIAAVAVFFVPLIVNLLISMVADSSKSDNNNTMQKEFNFWQCWSGKGSTVSEGA